MTWRNRLGAALLMAVLAGCVVNTPTIENTQVEAGDSPQPGEVSTPVDSQPQFQPTSPPAAPPTPAVLPTETPVPAATPAPIPTVGVTPLPTEGPATEFVPSLVPAGDVAIPVGSTTFVLDQQRLVLQLSGHTLIYVDEALLAEVDIFTPIADPSGNLLPSYGEVIGFIETDPTFAELVELESVVIAGSPARVFDGNTVVKPEAPGRAFITSNTGLTDDQLGWFPPTRVRMWVIDTPDQPIIVSAESLEDPGQFAEAQALAANLLTTIDFG